MLVFLFFAMQAFSQDYETVVKDIVFNSSNRLVITEEVIEKSLSRDIPSLLATVANISVTSSSFQPTSISMRGGDSGHVLILVDGIPFYDPSTIQRTGNLSALNIKTVKKIEIIKGSQSVLYGGQALGGVIKIETLGTEDRLAALAETGTQAYWSGGLEYSTKNIVARGYLKGKSAESPAKRSSRHYAQDQQNMDLVYRWKSATEGYVKASYLRDYSHSPSSDMNTYQIVDVSNFKLSSEQGFLSTFVDFKDAKWNPRLSLGLQNGFRFYQFPLSALNTFPIDEDYKSHFHFLRLDLRPLQNETLTIDAGISYSFEDFIFQEFNMKTSDAFVEQRGLFVKVTSLLDTDTVFSYGARLENWSGQDPVSVFQVGLGLKNTKIEVSTGYKAPSLYQLHSNYGNPDLKEERGSQISLTQDFGDFSFTVFQSRFENLISTTGTFPAIRYSNINKTETRGLEVLYNYSLAQEQKLVFNLGYQEPKDLDQHTWLPRRPLVNGSIRYLFGDDRRFGTAELVGIGTRKDVGPNGRVRLSSYALLNLSYSYLLNKSGKLFLRADNVTGSRHQETFGYYAEGTSAVLGWASGF